MQSIFFIFTATCIQSYSPDIRLRYKSKMSQHLLEVYNRTVLRTHDGQTVRKKVRHRKASDDESNISPLHHRNIQHRQ